MDFTRRRHPSANLPVLLLAFACSLGAAPNPLDLGVETDTLVYHSAMDTAESVKGWVMEGPGQVEFANGWMEMRSPDEEMHHVYWCPETLPSNFMAQWEMQNLHLEAGLCIVFFAATGLQGEDVMGALLPKRDGTFSQYNNGALKNYHISYYAHNPNLPARPVARLRKNPGRNIVSEGPPGIDHESDRVHKITLIKNEAHVRLYVDDRLIIDWEDNGEVNGPPLGSGRISLRQMQWTHFRYRNFKVWSLLESKS